MKDDFILQKKTDIGLVRDKNEDSALVLTHPKNNNIKLLAIADGMGGKDLGDVASSYVVNELGKWFKSRKVEELNEANKISKEIEKLIKIYNNDLIEKYNSNKLGTTLTLALVNEKDTVVTNVGDSRCYLYLNEELLQITEDDSQVWLYYKAGEVDKEDLRYFSTSNYISACIGLNKDLCTPKSIVIPNDSYKMILMFTDGVTDLITDKKIKELIQNNNEKQILDKIIQEAVYVDQRLHVPLRLRRNYREPFYIPSRGKDNATGAILIKKDV